MADTLIPDDITSLVDETAWRQALARRPNSKYFDENRKYYEGDHWQKGEQWVGPSVDRNVEGGAELWAQLEKAFVSKNLIRECVNRHADAFIGQEPRWGFTVRRALGEIKTKNEFGDEVIKRESPTDEEQALIDEAEALLTTWWDNRRVMPQLQAAAQALGWAGRAALRLYTPPSVLNAFGEIEQEELDRSLEKIYVLHTDPAQSGVLLDEHGVEIGAFYQYSDGDIDFEERVFLDDEGNTIIAVYKGEQLQEYVIYPLDRRLTIHEMRRPELIQQSTKQNQNLVNMAKTMMSRNVVQGGFLERIIMNAQMPGEWKRNETTKKMEFIPAPFKVGPGTTNMLSGIQETDDQGRPTGRLANPSVYYRDPVPVDTFLDTKRDAEYDVYSEFCQLHVLMASDATATGVSRQQATSDFEASIEPSQREIERLIRWLLETALKMAAVFSGEPDKFDELRAYVECRTSTTKPTPDEQRIAIEQKNAGIISLETAMNRSGIDDPDAEKAVIANEQIELFTLLDTRQRQLRGEARPGSLPSEDDELN